MSNLISALEMNQYAVESPVGLLGYVDRLFFNDVTWQIPSFRMSDLHKLIRNHLVIPNRLVDRVDKSSRRVFLKHDSPSLSKVGNQASVLHLHCTEDLNGFNAVGPEGVFGKVIDVIFNPETWEIAKLVLHSRQGLVYKNYLIEPKAIEKIVWSDSKIMTSLGQEALLKLPQLHLSHSDLEKGALAG